MRPSGSRTESWARAEKRPAGHGPESEPETRRKDKARLWAPRRGDAEGEARITWGTRLSRACYFVVFVAGVEQNEPCRQRLCSSTSNSVLLHPVRPFQQDLCCLFMSSAIPVSALQPWATVPAASQRCS